MGPECRTEVSSVEKNCPVTAPIPRGSESLVEPVGEVKLDRTAHGNLAVKGTGRLSGHLRNMPVPSGLRKTGACATHVRQILLRNLLRIKRFVFLRCEFAQ